MIIMITPSSSPCNGQLLLKRRWSPRWQICCDVVRTCAQFVSFTSTAQQKLRLCKCVRIRAWQSPSCFSEKIFYWTSRINFKCHEAVTYVWTNRHERCTIIHILIIKHRVYPTSREPQDKCNSVNMHFLHLLDNPCCQHWWLWNCICALHLYLYVYLYHIYILLVFVFVSLAWPRPLRRQNVPTRAT